MKPIKTILTWAICCLLCTQLCAQALPQTGKASYYHQKYTGHKTANAEVYDPTLFTAAHQSLAIGSMVQVTNLTNGKVITVKINDRCACSRHGRIIDLSYAAAKELDFLDRGITRVKLSKP
jgi:rare lipoprotein A